jgi:hypothetical protein
MVDILEEGGDYGLERLALLMLNRCCIAPAPTERFRLERGSDTEIQLIRTALFDLSPVGGAPAGAGLPSSVRA